VGPPDDAASAWAPVREVSDLLRAHRRLETMFRANLIGTITWRLDGTITGANDASRGAR
jgi:PAS domain-containing protein